MSTMLLGTADRRPAPSPGYSPVGLVAVMTLTAAAGVVHLSVVPAHLADYLPFGVFFLVVGAAQLAAAGVAALRASRRLLLGIAAGQVLLVGLWLLSRTTGLPLGPEPWTAEDIGVADVVCVGLELASVAVAAGLAGRGRRSRRRHRMRTPLGAGAVGLLVAVATVVGAGCGWSGMPVAFSAAPPSTDPHGTPVTALVDPPGPQPVRSFTLTAEQAMVDGAVSDTFDGTVPGPLLRVTQGERVRVRLVNRLPVATTLHWHGIAVPNPADGVAGLTQDAVPPGDEFTYEFTATEAGTFWYHSHQDTGTQIPAGLFGALVVEPAGGRVAQDVDRTVLLHNAHGADGSAAVAVDGTTGDLHIPARPGQTVRLRIIDAVAPGMDGTVQAPVLLGAPYRVVALDGRDLSDPGLLGPRRLMLGMGQRADIVFTQPASGQVRLIDSQVAGTPSAVQRFFGPPAATAESVSIGDGAAPAPVDPARVAMLDPLTYGAPAPDPTTAPADLTAPVVLGEHPGFHDGAVQLVHAINGDASPQVPPIAVHTGQLVALHIVNTTGEYHPMHLHGHVMSVLAVDGRAPQGSPLHLDTVLVGPYQSVDVAFRADNPGIWMLHCHVLLHATMGMSMTINYAGITTPFSMGSRSGNTPE